MGSLLRESSNTKRTSELSSLELTGFPPPSKWVFSVALSPSCSWAISWIKLVAQSQSNCPALEGSSENQRIQENVSLRSSGAQRLGPSWSQGQSLYSRSANNRAFSRNEETVNSEVMKKKKASFHIICLGELNVI